MFLPRDERLEMDHRSSYMFARQPEAIPSGRSSVCGSLGRCCICVLGSRQICILFRILNLRYGHTHRSSNARINIGPTLSS
jgi:hypothetical protein